MAHRPTRPRGSRFLMIEINAAWSVMILNFHPLRYRWNFSTAHITANPSL